MNKLLRALRNHQVVNPYIIAQINKSDDPQKKQHPVDLSCFKIEKCRNEFGNEFDIIVYVKIKNGFYIIPFKDIDPWVMGSKTQTHPNYESGVKRLWFREPDFFRCTGMPSRNMEEYFHDMDRMKTWLGVHDPDLLSLFPENVDSSFEISADEYVETIQILLDNGAIGDNIKICLAALRESPLAMAKMSALLGFETEKSVRPLFANFVTAMCDILGKDKTPYPRRSMDIIASRERDPRQNNEYVHQLRPNFLEALERFPVADWRKLTPDPLEQPTSAPPVNVFYRQIDEILEYKKQVILYGPPGTGKTHLADEYVAYKTGSRENEFIFRCIFHPEYGYEHFIEGFKPEVSNGQMTFVRRDGIFKKMCDKARNDKAHEYYLIIDEINRGDIPRIFGELIALTEADKRVKSKATLPHSGEDFRVPENVYIIATMNTADRSIALLDAALRRRFGFIEMEPDPAVLGHQVIDGTHLGEWLRELNKKLSDELKKIRSDARHLKIGHSYLMAHGKAIRTQTQFKRIVRFEILPLLEEYCYGESEVFERLKDHVVKSLKEGPDSQDTVENSERNESIADTSPDIDASGDGA